MSEKPYLSLNEFYKSKFGTKIFKVSLDAGFSCPNKDGTKGTGGCIFCNGAPGVGEVKDSLEVQFDKVKNVLHKKWPSAKYIAYFEANTNTYAPIDKLRKVYEKVLSFDGVVGISIATRCDAITDDIYEYLDNLNKRTFLSIELGLQSSFDETLKLVNRRHTKLQFTNCVKKLKSLGINVVVHIINGFPNETKSMMLDTVRYVNSLGVDGIKFHMLYIEEGTKLAEMYKEKPFRLLTREEYIDIITTQINLLDKNIVVHRLISGPDNKKLIEPKWLLGKFKNLNAIEEALLNKRKK